MKNNRFKNRNDKWNRKFNKSKKLLNKNNKINNYNNNNNKNHKKVKVNFFLEWQLKKNQ
jgi:hypothetical protein